MSDPIRIYFELDENADPEKVRSSLAEGLRHIEGVEASEVRQPDQRISGLEIAAAIGAAIVVAKGAQEAIEVTAAVIASVTKLVRSIKGLRTAILETPSGPKPLEEVTESDVASLAGV